MKHEPRCHRLCEDGSLREHRLLGGNGMPPVPDYTLPEGRQEKPLEINRGDVVKMIDAFMVDGEMHVQEVQALVDKIEETLALIYPSFTIDADSRNDVALLQIARDLRFIDPSTYNTLVDKMQFAKNSKTIEKPKSLTLDERFLLLSPEEMHAQIQAAKQSAERFRRDARRNRSRSGTTAYSQYWHLRNLFDQAHGKDYSMYLRERKGTVPDFSSVRDVQSVPGTNLLKGRLPDGRSITFNPRTGSYASNAPQEISSESRDLASSSRVSTDELRDAKRILDRGPMAGGRYALPTERYASDGRVNFFTEGDRRDVQDFLNARSARRLARLEQMEGFAAQRADIMDILTNPDRFEAEVQKIKDAPIDFSDPRILRQARKNNVVHSLLSRDHSMIHDVATEPPTRAEIESLRRDGIFRDSWEKVRRKNDNMMNFDQFITFRQTGWEDRDTEKFIPTMAKDGYIPGYAYIFHKPTRQEMVLNSKGEIVAHRWQKRLEGGKFLLVDTRFDRPKNPALKSLRIDFKKTWGKEGVPGKLALRDSDGTTLPKNFSIDLSTFPRDGRGMMIGNIAWVERDGNNAFKVLLMKEGNYDLYAQDGASKTHKHADIAVSKGPEKRQVA